ncbi:MAG: RnfABCDGE type electron transport complex subunit G [Pseudomonadota bacterium]
MTERADIPAWRSALVLTVIAGVCTFVVGATYAVTKDRIESNKLELLRAQFAPVMGSVAFDDINFDGARTIASERLPGSGTAIVYQAYAGGLPAARLYKVDTLGYAGKMELLIGIDPAHEITGVRVLSHSETPGLGDAIDISKSNWIESFRSKSLQNPDLELWRLQDNGGFFDQFTGASITPGAVVDAVKKTLVFVTAEANP